MVLTEYVRLLLLRLQPLRRLLAFPARKIAAAVRLRLQLVSLRRLLLRGVSRGAATAVCALHVLLLLRTTAAVAVFLLLHNASPLLQLQSMVMCC